jgi:hypothetical protein
MDEEFKRLCNPSDRDLRGYGVENAALRRSDDVQREGFGAEQPGRIR